MSETHVQRIQKATHCYIGKQACGCTVAVVVDSQDKETGKDVAEFIRDGYTIERITIEEFRTSKQPFGCTCQKAK